MSSFLHIRNGDWAFNWEVDPSLLDAHAHNHCTTLPPECNTQGRGGALIYLGPQKDAPYILEEIGPYTYRTKISFFIPMNRPWKLPLPPFKDFCWTKGLRHLSIQRLVTTVDAQHVWLSRNQVFRSPELHRAGKLANGPELSRWHDKYGHWLRGWFATESRAIRGQSWVQISRFVPSVPPGVPNCLQDTTDGKGFLYSNPDAKFTIVSEAEVTDAQVCKSSKPYKGAVAIKYLNGTEGGVVNIKLGGTPTPQPLSDHSTFS